MDYQAGSQIRNKNIKNNIGKQQKNRNNKENTQQLKKEVNLSFKSDDECTKKEILFTNRRVLTPIPASLPRYNKTSGWMEEENLTPLQPSFFDRNFKEQQSIQENFKEVKKGELQLSKNQHQNSKKIVTELFESMSSVSKYNSDDEYIPPKTMKEKKVLRKGLRGRQNTKK